MSIKIGVIGIGHLGKIHISQLNLIEDAQVVGLYDADHATAQKIAEEHQIPFCDSIDVLIEASDAIIISTPTPSHFNIAKQVVQSFKHVFIEKPITETLEEAYSLQSLVEEAGVVAQIGHVERFNPAFLAIGDFALKPMFVETHRLAQWNPRGTDVSVVLDLMIHDIDILLHIVKDSVKRIFANGVSIISQTPDIANARIEFNNGCVANLTASRLSMKNMRKMRVFQHNAYLTIDFLEKQTEIITIEKSATKMEKADTLTIGDNQLNANIYQPAIPQINSIREELRSFINSIQNKSESLVTVDQAVQSMVIAHDIMDKIS